MVTAETTTLEKARRQNDLRMVLAEIAYVDEKRDFNRLEEMLFAQATAKLDQLKAQLRDEQEGE